MSSTPPSLSPSPSTTLTTTKPSLLTLPPELRHKIHLHLFPPSHLSTLTIRSLFIRAHYRNIYMTQQPKNLSEVLPMLRVCRQISAECLPVLYAGPVWKCGTRMDELGSQIGGQNFGRIRRMEVGFEDLEGVVESLTGQRETGRERGGGLELERRRLRFDGLEELRVEGYQASALGEGGSEVVGAGLKRARLEAARLCWLARSVLSLHPILGVLLQQDEGDFGGADGVDMSLGRVKWRFVRSTVEMEENECVVDLDHVIRVLKEMLDASRGMSISSPPAWMEHGRYKQYPHLPG